MNGFVLMTMIRVECMKMAKPLITPLIPPPHPPPPPPATPALALSKRSLSATSTRAWSVCVYSFFLNYFLHSYGVHLLSVSLSLCLGLSTCVLIKSFFMSCDNMLYVLHLYRLSVCWLLYVCWAIYGQRDCPNLILMNSSHWIT